MALGTLIDFVKMGLLLAVAVGTAQLILLFRPRLRGALEAEVRARRLLPLDGLRGILCIGIVLHHAAITQAMIRAGDGWPQAEAPTFELLGHSGVAFFFCTTGFLFWGRVIEHGIHLRWLEFYRGRVFRIVPLYVLMAALAATLLLTDRNADAVSTSRLINFFGEVFSFGFRNWSPVDAGTRIIRTESFDAGVHWSLRYEWMFYIALPLLAAFARGIWPIVLLILAIAAARMFGSASMLPLSLMFVIGMAAAHAVRSQRMVDRLRDRWAAVLVVLATALLFACTVSHSWMFGLTPTANGFSPLAFALTAAIFVPIAAGNAIFSLLDRPALRLVGVVSYSVYLLHGIVLYIARPWTMPLVAPAPSINVAYWIASAGLCAVIVGLSCVTYAFVEQPFIAWDRRLRRRASVDELASPRTGGYH